MIVNVKNIFSNNKVYLYLSLFFLTLKLLLLKIISQSTNFSTPDSIGYLALSSDLIQNYLMRPPAILEISLIRTPGYPAFLFLLNNSLDAIIFVQIVLHLIMSFIALLLLNKIKPNSNNFTKYLIFTLIQIESSLLVYSFRILSEIIFAFFILVLLYLLALKHKQLNKTKINMSIFLVLAIIFMIRPIAVAFFVVFVIMAFITPLKQFYSTLLIVSLMIVGGYSLFNQSKAGVFTYSLIQNHNLLYWEAAGAKAISLKSPLKDIQDQERERLSSIMGTEKNYEFQDSYNRSRALEIIEENKISFVKMHFIGIAKILYGPNRFELIDILSDRERITLNNNIKNIVVGTSLFTTILISTLGFIGSIRFFSYGPVFKFMTLLLIVMLGLSGGPQAYGRFRVPISVILVIYASIFIDKQFLSNQSTRRKISMHFKFFHKKKKN